MSEIEEMKWIKCSEQMPPMDSEGFSPVVLAVGPNKRVTLNYLFKGKWGIEMNVTHWMLPPQLPEEYQDDV